MTASRTQSARMNLVDNPLRVSKPKIPKPKKNKKQKPVTSRMLFEQAKNDFNQGLIDERTKRKFEEIKKIRKKHIGEQKNYLHHHSMSQGLPRGFNANDANIGNLKNSINII